MTKKKKIFLFMVVVLILMTVFRLFGGSKIERETKKYLKQKYKEEFVVENVRYIWQNKSYEIRVHPKKNPDMSFVVNKWAMMGYSLSDGYIRKIRHYETSNWIKKEADKISSKNLVASYPQGIEELKECVDMSYSVEDIINSNGDKFMLALRIFYFIDITDKNREEVSKKIYNLIEYLKSKKFSGAEIEILFFDEQYFRNKDVVWIEKNEMGPSGMMNFESQYYNYLKAKLNIYNKIIPTFKIKQGIYKDIKSYKDIENIILTRKLINEGADWRWE